MYFSSVEPDLHLFLTFILLLIMLIFSSTSYIKRIIKYLITIFVSYSSIQWHLRLFLLITSPVDESYFLLPCMFSNFFIACKILQFVQCWFWDFWFILSNIIGLYTDIQVIWICLFILRNGYKFC